MADTPPRQAFNWRVLVTSFRPHVLVFAAVSAALIVIDARNPGASWAQWPVMIWAALVGVHYMGKKLLSVDDGWAEERVGELFYRAYDAGQIQDIKSVPRPMSVGGKDAGDRGDSDAPPASH